MKTRDLDTLIVFLLIGIYLHLNLYLLGIYLEKKGEILGMLPERMDNRQVASMLLGAITSRDLGPGRMTKEKEKIK